MVPWYDLIREITLWLRDCPEPILVKRLQMDAAQFFRDTWAWRTDVVALATVVSGQRDYDLSAVSEAGLDFVGLAKAWAGVEEIGLTAGRGEIPPTQASSADWTVGLVAPATLRITPAPLLGGAALTGVLAVAPNSVAAGIPVEIWQDCRTALVPIAVSRLASMPAKPWTDAELSRAMTLDGRVQLARIANQRGLRAGHRRPMLRVKPADGASAEAI